MILMHILASLVAAVLGLFVLVLQKGTLVHRISGFIYAGAIYLVSVSGFFIQEVTGSVSIFHWFSVQAIILVSAGLVVPLWLRQRVRVWPVWHLRFMLYSYITLVLTGVAQFFDYLPLSSDTANAIVFLSAPAMGSVIAIERFGVARWQTMLTKTVQHRPAQG